MAREYPPCRHSSVPTESAGWPSRASGALFIAPPYRIEKVQRSLKDEQGIAQTTRRRLLGQRDSLREPDAWEIQSPLGAATSALPSICHWSLTGQAVGSTFKTRLAPIRQLRYSHRARGIPDLAPPQLVPGYPGPPAASPRRSVERSVSIVTAFFRRCRAGSSVRGARIALLRKLRSELSGLRVPEVS